LLEAMNKSREEVGSIQRGQKKQKHEIWGHPFMTSTQRGEGVRLGWTHVDGGGGSSPHVDVHTEN